MSDEILKGIDLLSKKMDSSKTEYEGSIAEVKKHADAASAEVKSLLEKSEKLNAEQISEVNEKLTKHGKTVGEIAAEVSEIKRQQGSGLIGSTPEGKSAKGVIVDFMNEKMADFKSLSKQTPLKYDIKAAGNITISGISQTGSVQNMPLTYQTGYYTRPFRQLNLRDLIKVIPSATGAVVFIHQKPNAIPNGSFNFQAGQSNLKAQMDYPLEMVNLTLDYLAGYARVAKQMLTDFPNFQEFIAGQLLEDYRRSESAAFIPSLTSQSTAYTNASTVSAEKIIYAIANLYGQDWSPNGIVTDANTWGKIMNTKPNDYSLPGGGSAVTIGADGSVQFVGMPLLVQNNMTANTILVGDFSQAAIFQADGLSLAFFEQDQDNAIRNLVTARVEARVGLGVFRADAFNYFTAGTT